MDTNQVYTKSEKGKQALRETGALDSQERLFLLYVSGTRTNGAIIENLSSRMSIAEAIQCFERLESKGFILGTDRSFASGSQPTERGRHIDMETKKFIETEMIEYIGPMAKIICADIWKKTDELETAIELLSSSLPDNESVEAFTLSVLQRNSS